MAWRVVCQPDGLFARFSEIVDNFTHMNCSEEEILDLCEREAGRVEARNKVQRARENPQRWEEALDIIRRHHGEGRAGRIKLLGEVTDSFRADIIDGLDQLISAHLHMQYCREMGIGGYKSEEDEHRAAKALQDLCDLHDVPYGK